MERRKEIKMQLGYLYLSDRPRIPTLSFVPYPDNEKRTRKLDKFPHPSSFVFVIDVAQNPDSLLRPPFHLQLSERTDRYR